MQKRYGYVLIYTIAFFFASQLHAQDISQLIPVIKDAIFTVYAQDEDGQVYSSGSGFFITQSGIGVTNYHVLRGANGGYIKCTNGQEYTIQNIVDYNPQYDIVKFQVQKGANHTFPYLKIQSQLPAQGTAIVSYSNPLGSFENTVSTGIVSAIRDYQQYGKVLQITAPISHGSSGSPVMNQKGEVLGIATFGIEAGQSLNFAVSILQLQKMTKSLGIPVSHMQENPFETPVVKRGQVLALQERFEEAFAAFDEAIQKDSLNYLAYYYKGLWLCRTQGDLAGIEDLLHACSIDTTCYDCHLKTAEFLKNTMIRMHDDGADIPEQLINVVFYLYGKCMDIDPYRPEAYGDLGYTLLYVGQNKNLHGFYEDGVNYLNTCIELLPTSEIYYMYRAELYKAMKDYGRALIDCDYAMELDRENWRPYFIKGIIQTKWVSQIDDGLLTLFRAESLAPTPIDKAVIQGFIGDAYLQRYMTSREPRLWDINQAVEYLRKAYEVIPSQVNKLHLETAKALSESHR